jgi:DHA1 family tetracycline resistance protein-like MFS transporter
MEKASPIALWLVLFTVLLDWMGIGLVYPMFSTMLFSSEGPLLDPMASGAVRGFYLGLLLAAMPISQFFAGPILGTISDQKGRKPLLVLTLVLGVAGYILCTIGVMMQNVLLLIAARFINGISAGNSAVVSAAIADISLAETKSKNFGLYSMSCGVGFTVGPILGGQLSEFGYSIPFLVAGIATVLNLLFILFLFKETHFTRKNAPIRFNEGLRNLKKALHIPRLNILFLTVLFFCFGWSFFFEFLPVAWIHDYHFNSGHIGFFFAYGAAIYALSSGLLIRPIVNRFHNGTVLFFALLAQGIVILTLLKGFSEFWVWIYLPVVNFLSALVFPTSTTMVSDWADKEAQGETLGILASVQSAAFALSPLAAGSLLGENPHMPMAIGGLSMLAAALLIGTKLRKQIF